MIRLRFQNWMVPFASKTVFGSNWNRTMSSFIPIVNYPQNLNLNIPRMTLTFDTKFQTQFMTRAPIPQWTSITTIQSRFFGTSTAGHGSKNDKKNGSGSKGKGGGGKGERKKEPSLAWMHDGKFYDEGPDQILPSTAVRSWHRHGAVKLKMQETGLASLKPISVPTFLDQSSLAYADRTAMIIERDGKTVEWTYADYILDVRTAAKGFIALGLEPFHSVCIMGFNSPEWFISNLAAIFAGGLSAGIYATNTPETCLFCASDSEANIYVVEDEIQLAKILEIRDQLPHLKAIIQYSGSVPPGLKDVYTWDELMELGHKQFDLPLEGRLSKISINQCCSLIYTSGTTGPPKGVMLTHDNVTWMALVSKAWADFESPSDQGFQEVVLSFLPLSHIAAQMADIYCATSCAACVVFADKNALKGTLGESLRNYQPTKFMAVPKVWEAMHEKLSEAIGNTKGFKKIMAKWAMNEALKSCRKRMNGVKNHETPAFHLANYLVLRKIRAALGLQRADLFLSGAAPLSPQIMEFFMSLNIPVTEGYGMSETTGPHAMAIPLPGMSRLQSVGLTMAGCLTKIDKPDVDGNGEILMNGRHITMGYLHLPEITKSTIDSEGWVHSEDIGRIDSDGFLYVTGRMKELLVTVGGENIAPVPIEERLVNEIPPVSQAIVLGDKRKFVSALITLKTQVDPETMTPQDFLLPAAKSWIEQNGDCKVNLVQDVIRELGDKNNLKLRNAFDAAVEKVNERAVSKAARIRKWVILPTDFSLPGGEIGPTLKLKRKVVYKKYAKTIEEIYKE